MAEDIELMRRHLSSQRKKLAQALEKGDMESVATAARSLTEIQQRLGEEADPDALQMTVGGGGSTGGVRKKEDQDEAAAMFDKLSPGELTRLYLEDRPRWEAIMAAKEEAGMRRLFETN